GRRADRSPARLARAELRRPVAELRPPPPAAHQRGDLRLRRLRPDGEQPVRRSAHLAGRALPAQARGLRVLGLAGGHRRRRDLAAARLHARQGIRRARVADRDPDRGRLGRLRDRLLRHDRQAQGAPHLRRQLVLRRVHHRRRAAAHRQRRGDPGRLDEELLGLRGRAGRDGPVVVRPQRGRLLPHRGLPRDDVLLHPEAGRAAGLFVPALDRPLLGADLHLHVGGPAPPSLHRAARLGAVGGDGVLARPARAELGGMINGMMTLSGAWHKLRDDPILKFLIVSLSFYGMSTFEGPMMSIKTVNALSHYTDWTIGHVHSGALGWVGFITMGALYYLVPRLFGQTQMFSVRAISLHFWIATVGIVLYIAAMWIAGVMQGLMWRAVSEDGTLTYTFVESVKATYPFYAIRLLGGVLYLSGMLVMAWNVLRTVTDSKPSEALIPAPAHA